jgi:hypothetical protein
MMKIVLALMFTLATLTSNAQVHVWSRIIGGTGSEFSRSVVTDNSGNVYVAGTFTDAMDFNTSPGDHVSDSSTSSGYRDIFISKYNQTGAYQWTITFGGSEDDHLDEIVLGHDGSILVCGYFKDTVDFDPSPFTEVIKPSAGARDAFLAVFENDGTFRNVYTFGGTENDMATHIVFNPVINEYALCGFFEVTADLNPDSNVEDNRTSNGGADVFIAFFSNGWTYTESVVIGGTGGDNVSGIDVDSAGNYYACGWFTNEVNFEPSSSEFIEISAGGNDGFLMQLSPDHQINWIRILGGTGDDYFRSIAIKDDILYAGCEFSQTISVSGVNYTSNGYSDIALLRYDLAGNVNKMVHIGNYYTDEITSMCFDSTTNIVITGSFGPSIVDFNPLGAEPFNLGDNLNINIYLAKYDTTGLLKWAGAFSNQANASGFDLTVNPAGEIILTGFVVCLVDSVYYPDVLAMENPLQLIGSNDGILSVYKDPSTEAGFLSFSIPGQLGNTLIDEENLTVTVTMPAGTDLTALVPSIVYSNGSVTPDIYWPVDFTNPVLYTIIAQDRITKHVWTVTVDAEPTAISNPELELKMTISPNPAQDFIRITSPVQNGTINICNVGGASIHREDFLNNHVIEIPLKGFTPGIYLIRIISEDKVYTAKFSVTGT